MAKKDISLCLTCDKRNTKSWKFFILLTDLPFGPKNTYMLYKKIPACILGEISIFVQKVAKNDISLCLTYDKRNTKSWKFFILPMDLPFGPNNTHMLYKKIPACIFGEISIFVQKSG